MRRFPLDEIVTCVTGRLVAKRKIEACYDLLGYMTDTQPFTHQLPRLNKVCAEHLTAIHPELANIDVSRLDTLLAMAADPK